MNPDKQVIGFQITQGQLTRMRTGVDTKPVHAGVPQCVQHAFLFGMQVSKSPQAEGTLKCSKPSCMALPERGSDSPELGAMAQLRW